MQTKKLCKYPGCFNYATEDGYCDKHQEYRIADAQKPKTHRGMAQGGRMMHYIIQADGEP